MMEDKPNYYAVIPAVVRYDNKLRDKAKLIYGEITALCNKNGECWASNGYFAKLYNINTDSISKLICELVDNGYLKREIVYKDNSKEIEKRVLIPIVQINYTYSEKEQKGIVQNDKENNTSINNSSSSRGNIYDFIQSTLGIILNDIEYRTISTWEDNDLTRYVIEQAGLNRARSIKYISKVLQAYKQDGIQTINEAIDRDSNYKNRKTNYSYKPKQTHTVITEEFEGGVRIL